MKTHTLYLRTIIFGINDSLVSTVGFLAGISVAGVPRATIALIGIIVAYATFYLANKFMSTSRSADGRIEEEMEVQ